MELDTEGTGPGKLFVTTLISDNKSPTWKHKWCDLMLIWFTKHKNCFSWLLGYVARLVIHFFIHQPLCFIDLSQHGTVKHLTTLRFSDGPPLSFLSFPPCFCRKFVSLSLKRFETIDNICYLEIEFIFLNVYNMVVWWFDEARVWKTFRWRATKMIDPCQIL